MKSSSIFEKIPSVVGLRPPNSLQCWAPVSEGAINYPPPRQNPGYAIVYITYLTSEEASDIWAPY